MGSKEALSLRLGGPVSLYVRLSRENRYFRRL